MLARVLVEVGDKFHGDLIDVFIIKDGNYGFAHECKCGCGSSLVMMYELVGDYPGMGLHFSKHEIKLISNKKEMISVVI